MVSLLDGSLLALDPDTGTTSWTLDLGSPLLSSSGTWFESSVENEDHVSHSILPGADGSLYIFTDASGAGQALEVVADLCSILAPQMYPSCVTFRVLYLMITLAQLQSAPVANLHSPELLVACLRAKQFTFRLVHDCNHTSSLKACL